MVVDIDNLLELEAKATPKDWDLNWYGGHLFLTYPIEGKFATSDDLELMTVMRNSIRELCLELRASRKVVEAARLVYEFYGDPEDLMELNDAIEELDKVTDGR